MTGGAGPLFEPGGDTFVPTPLSAGPWDPTVLHGGPVGALFAVVLEDMGGPGFAAVRLTVDLMRPVPMRPLGFAGRIVRQGRRLQLLEGELNASGTAVARCSLLRLGSRPVELGPTGSRDEPPDDDPEGFFPARPLDGYRPTAFVGGAVEVRSPGEPGTFLGVGLAWFRLVCEVLPGRPPTPLAAAASVGDMGNALSAPSGVWPPPIAYVNGDMSLHLARPPEGEWVRSAASSTWSELGIGLARAELSDRKGSFGVAHQALALAPRT